MKRYATEQLRNVALVAHSGAGKTSLMEALLYVAGATERQGRVEDGNTVSDYDPEEIRRKMSVHASVAAAEWKDCKLNIIDSPGYGDFAGEVAGALRAADGALFVAAAQAAGVGVGFEVAWEYAEAEKVARAIFINKMDKENADYFKVVDKLRARYGKVIAPAELPIGSGLSFHGVVDLVHLKAYKFVDGARVDYPDGVPEDMQDAVDQYREQLIESAAEFNDDLLEKYLGGEELTSDEIERGLHDGMSQGKVAPVLCGSATKDMGVRMLLDLISAEFPHPGEHGARHGVDPASGSELRRLSRDSEPVSAQVFKTISDPYVGKLTYFRVYSGVLKSDSGVLNVRAAREERIGQLYYLRGKQQIPVTEIGAGDIGAVGKLAETRTSDTLAEKAKPVLYDPILFPRPMYAVAVSARTKADEDKLGAALHRLEEENPGFSLRRDPETAETLMAAVGEAQIEILVDRLKRFGAQVETRLPRVPYRETVRGKAKAEGRHKKQTGGRGQFGDCWIELEPAERGAGFVFVDAIVGGAIPRQYIPAVKNGICEAMARGVLSGNPVVDVKATLYDGKFHEVDSSEAAFKIAGSLAFQNAATLARPVLLEPVMKACITVPGEYMGDVMGDLNTRRGRVLGMERDDADSSGRQRISASVPQAELLTYAIELRSLTHGRGAYTAEFSHYEEAPQNVEQEVIKQAVKAGFSIHVEH